MSTSSVQSETVTFAAGCFWGVQYMFLKHHSPEDNKGILKTAVGYTGGKDEIKNPSYEDVCSGTTNHAEALKIEFDPSLVSYAELVEFFFQIHDPTTTNQQGNSFGTQYRSIIFIHSSEQLATAERVAQEVQAIYFDPHGTKIVTEILEAGPWWDAEEYHQLDRFYI